MRSARAKDRDGRDVTSFVYCVHVICGEKLGRGVKGGLSTAEIKSHVSQASCLANTHGPGTNIDDTNKVESGPIATPFLNGHINGGTPEIGVSQKLLKRRL